MLRPSYSDLMKVVNSEVEPGETMVVNSRYSIVMATSKRARQIIAGDEMLVAGAGKKPLSVAIDELNQSKIKILTEKEARELEEAAKTPLKDYQEEGEDTELSEEGEGTELSEEGEGTELSEEEEGTELSEEADPEQEEIEEES